METLTIAHRDTREKFEAKCGSSRYVVVLADPGGSAGNYIGMVTNFHRGGIVSVVDAAGYTHLVPLQNLMEDRKPLSGRLNPATSSLPGRTGPHKPEEMPGSDATDALKDNEAPVCACGSPRRPGGHDCQKCHRERARESRRRSRERWKLLLKATESLTTNNLETREKFEAQSRCRWVVVIADADEDAEDFSGRVTAFHPGEMVTVVDCDGRNHAVPLRKVHEDLGRKFFICDQLPSP